MLVCGATCSAPVREAGIPKGFEEYERNGLCHAVACWPADDCGCCAAAVMLCTECYDRSAILRALMLRSVT